MGDLAPTGLSDVKAFPDSQPLEEKKTETFGSPSENKKAKVSDSQPQNRRGLLTRLHLPPEYDKHSLITRLWLQSLVDKDGKVNFSKAKGLRPFTLANVCILVDLLRQGAPGVLATLLQNQHRKLWWRFALRTAWKVSSGVLVTAELWVANKLTGLVEGALKGRPTQPAKAGSALALAIGLTALKALAGKFNDCNKRILDDHVELHTERAWLGFKVVQHSSHIDDSMHAALMDQCENFINERFDPKAARHKGGPSSLLDSVTNVLSRTIKMVSQVTLMLSVLKMHNSFGMLSLMALPLASSVAQLEILSPRQYAWQIRFDPKYSHLEQKVREANRNVTSTAYKEEIVLFNLGDWMVERWEERKLDLHAIDPTRIFVLDLKSLGLGALTNSVNNITSFLIATGLVFTKLSLTRIVMFQTAASRTVDDVGQIWISLKDVWEDVFNFGSYLALQEYQARSGGLDFEENRNDKGMCIEARGLSYKYKQSSQPTLKDISLIVEPGETLAIVGYNGGGKSTLLKVLVGLEPLAGGSLLFNGVDVQDYDPRTVRARISCLFQDFNKYSMTVAQNIGIGSVPHVDDEERIIQAARQSGAYRIVKKLGLNAKVALRGTYKKNDDDEVENGLSGGQWQRLALARAFMRPDADLVVFDEPSSALDPVAEAALFKDIHALSQGKDGHRITTIFISHRLSRVSLADKIAFVDKGTIAEFGTHAELMAREGQYHHFFTMQRDGFKDDNIDPRDKPKKHDEWEADTEEDSDQDEGSGS